MFRKMALTVFLLGSCVWCVAMVVGADAAQPSGGAEPFKPVASVEALMHGQKTFFQSIGQLLQEPNADAIHEVEEFAEVLAELANVNQYNEDKADYRAWARELRDKAMKLAAEADKKAAADVAQMKRMFESMKATCMACHDVYQ